MLIPIRCFTCGKVLADVANYYDKEEKKLKDIDTKSSFKDFGNVQTKEILDDLGLTRYCCRRHLISNVDMMNII